MSQYALPADDVVRAVFGNGVAAVFGADPTLNASHRTESSEPRRRAAERAAADRGHRGGTVGFHDLAGDADSVGIILGRIMDSIERWQVHRGDFAAPGPLCGRFHRRKIREVVVKINFFSVPPPV